MPRYYDKGNGYSEIYTYTGQKLGQGLSLVANLMAKKHLFSMEELVRLETYSFTS